MSTPPNPTSSKPPPLAQIAASIPRDRLYRLSLPFLMSVQQLGLGHHGLRLLHALVHATCRQTESWHKPHPRPPEGSLLPCQDIRRRLDLKSADNRILMTGCESLINCGLLDVLEFRNDNRWLAWRWTEASYEWLYSEPHYGYGYFDIVDIARLRTVWDFLIHDQLGVGRARTRPEFSIRLAVNMSWETQRRTIIRALQRSAALYGCSLVVLLECHGSRIGIDTAIVRMRLPHTRWGSKTLAKRSVECASLRRVLLIDAERLEEVPATVDPEDVQAFFAKRTRTAA